MVGGLGLRGVGIAFEFSSRQAVSAADPPCSGRIGQLPAWWSMGTVVTHTVEYMEVRIMANSLWVTGLCTRVKILELYTNLWQELK